MHFLGSSSLRATGREKKVPDDANCVCLVGLSGGVGTPSDPGVTSAIGRARRLPQTELRRNLNNTDQDYQNKLGGLTSPGSLPMARFSASPT